MLILIRCSYKINIYKLSIKKIKILILSDYAFTKGGAERVAISSAIGLLFE